MVVPGLLVLSLLPVVVHFLIIVTSFHTELSLRLTEM